MMLRHLGHRVMQCAYVEAFCSMQHHRLVKIVRLCRCLSKEPLLNRSQLNTSRNLALIGRTANWVYMTTQQRNGRILEQILHVQLVARLQQAGGYLDCFDRIAAQIKEII
ncbi:hypothetical protein D1872_177870 [compost metagenome]